MRRSIKSRLGLEILMGDADKHELLAELLAGMGAGEFELTYDAAGCPRVRAAGREIFVSLSDSGGLSAVAASLGGPVGVDVQHKCERPRVAARFFSEAEQKLPFALVWARKEAYAKALGEGLTREILGLDSCRLGEFLEVDAGDYVVVAKALGTATGR